MPALQNLYIARLTSQDRPCFVCSKFTMVVLSSANKSNDDWFYVCRTHLGDINFCSKIGGPPGTKSKPTVSKSSAVVDTEREPESDSVYDLVSSIGSAFTTWRNKGKDDGKKESKDGDEDKEDKKDSKKDSKKESKEDKDATNSPASSPSPSKPADPPRFILQRDYFYMRQREQHMKQQKKEAADRLKTLDFPKTPTHHPKSAS
ncbi:hypothetical protein DM01DRAFT_1135670 [Hesseltinella vesiculosa]|uniref:DUF1742-domain-containing protein n=1 Tax=Hesseltinella vesiculosa TaxID=101127 RepID=A0A1X2G8B1_9FUNG|nr:hypothetical protein DM01DRAFT_1135670 [Hesseltinella vesiculosa]